MLNISVLKNLTNYLGNQMRNLIIFFIQLILFAYPLFADSHKRKVLYGWETSSGIQLRGFGEKAVHPLYEGDAENREPQRTIPVSSPPVQQPSATRARPQDLNTERLPCWSDEGDEGFSRAACGESFVGVVMFLTNTVMPAGSLVFGFLTDGLTYDINWDEVNGTGNSGGLSR